MPTHPHRARLFFGEIFTVILTYSSALRAAVELSLLGLGTCATVLAKDPGGCPHRTVPDEPATGQNIGRHFSDIPLARGCG